MRNLVRRSARRRTLLACVALTVSAVPVSAFVKLHPQRPATPPQFISPPNLCENQVPVENAYIRCLEPVYDFGHIRGGPDRPLWHAFEIENICDRPVRVQVINPGCGTCARDKSWIQPGQSVFFDVTLFTNYAGPVTKRITVEVIELGDPIDSAN